MGMNREKKLREKYKLSQDEVAHLNRALDETTQLLSMAYAQMKLAGGKIQWLSSCIEEFQRQAANGLIRAYANE